MLYFSLANEENGFCERLLFLVFLLVASDSSIIDNFSVMYFLILRVFFSLAMLKGLLMVSYIFSRMFFFRYFFNYSAESSSACYSTLKRLSSYV